MITVSVGCGKSQLSTGFNPFPITIGTIKSCRAVPEFNLFPGKSYNMESIDSMLFCEIYRGNEKILKKRLLELSRLYCVGSNHNHELCKWILYAEGMVEFLGYNQRFLENSISIFLRGLQSYPQFSPYHFRLGLLYNMIEDCSSSINHLKKAVAFDSINIKYKLYLILTLSQCGKRGEAIVSLKELAPLNLKGEELLKAQKVELAIYKPCYDEPPEVHRLWYEGISKILQEREYNKLIDTITKGIDKYPLAACLRELLGILFIKIGNKTQGAVYLEEALKIDSNSWLALENLGYLYKEEDIDKAIYYFQRLLSLRPFYPTPYKELSQLFEKKGEIQNSVELLEKTIKLEGLLYETALKLLELYIKQNNFTAAKNLYNRLKEKYPSLKLTLPVNLK